MLLSYWVKGINYFRSVLHKSFIYQKLSESNFPDSIFALAKFELKYHKIKMIEAMPITLVIGASENPSRYSNLAVKKLLDNNFLCLLWQKAGAINDIEINTTLPKGVDVHTITFIYKSRPSGKYD